MSNYEISNPRIGKVGDPFRPGPGVNVEALLKAGFIRETSRTAQKSAKTSSKKTAPTQE